MKLTDIITFNFLRENKILVEVKTRIADILICKKMNLKNIFYRLLTVKKTVIKKSQ